MPLHFNRKDNSVAPSPDGLESWSDPLHTAKSGSGGGLRIPLWLLVLIFTVWISAILVTSLHLVAYAAGLLPAHAAEAALRPTATHTAAPTAKPSATPTATPRRVVTLYRSSTPQEASPEPVEELPTEEPEEGGPIYEEPTAEDLAAEPTPELPAETPEPTLTPTATPLPNPYEAHLVGVVDGSTIEVEVQGQIYRVRFLGINVPNKDNADARVAEIGRRAEELTSLLVQGAPLMLEWDVTDQAEDGALLRYVWADGRHIGLELVRQGLASVEISEVDTRYQDALYSAQLVAQNECLGLWVCP
ncbi:MAG: thermonuclease family protein [Chloroflexi bacterium]|nr:thermonuclease family protein [Chloroflexota bacterium]